MPAAAAHVGPTADRYTGIMMVVRCLQLIVIAALLLAPLGAQTPAAHIAFLDKGDVWVLAAGHGGPQRRTRTGGKVEDFRFSPRGEYLAYAKRLRPGDGRPICSIVIVAASTGDVIEEIRPDDGWIDIDKWLGTTLLYHASAAMEVSGFFEFDAVRRTGHEVDPQISSSALDSDMAPDGSLRVYVDYVGVGPTFEERLHLVDTATNADAVEVARRSVMAPAISPMKDAVAFIEVFGDGSKARDRVWVYRRADRSVTMIDDDAVRPKSGPGLTWSPDGASLLIDFGSNVTVLDVSRSSLPKKFRGVDACWSSPTTIVVGGPAGLDVIDVASRARRTIVTRGTRPQCVPAPTR